MPVPSSLSPWERWHRVSDDGEGKPVSKEHPHSDMHWLLSERYYRSSCNFPAASLPSQALRAKAGLRLPASASLSLASCWPLPQQLLPVSAAGGGRRRCPKGGATGVPVRPTRDEQSLILSETVVPCYRGQQLLDKKTLSSCCESL